MPSIFNLIENMPPNMLFILFLSAGISVLLINFQLSFAQDHIDALINEGTHYLEIKNYKKAILTFDKILLIEPNNIQAKQKIKDAFNNIDLITINDSKYLAYLQLYTRNQDGDLLSVVETNTVLYLNHTITDEFLDSFPPKEIVMIENKEYERWESSYTIRGKTDTWIGESGVDSYKYGFPIIIFRSFFHAVIIDVNDEVTITWNVFRLKD